MSTRLRILLGLMILILSTIGLPSRSSAYSITIQGDTVNWNVSGVINLKLRTYDLRPDGTHTYTYWADFPPFGARITLSVDTVPDPGHVNEDFDNALSLFVNQSKADIKKSGSCGGCPTIYKDCSMCAADQTLHATVTDSYAGSKLSHATSFYYSKWEPFASPPFYYAVNVAIMNRNAGQIWSSPELMGGPKDNPQTLFDEGDGPGSCSLTGLPRFRVNSATLNLNVRDSIFVSRGLGPNVDLALSYNADPSWNGMFGRSWKLSLESDLLVNCRGAVVRLGSGKSVAFNGNNWCAASPGVISVPYPYVMAPDTVGNHDQLTVLDPNIADPYVFEEKSSRLAYHFNAPGSACIGSCGSQPLPLQSIVDPNGNAVTLAYNTDRTLRSITDAAGRVTTFRYDANHHVISFQVPDGRVAHFSYDSHGYLKTAQDLLGTVTTYHYVSSGNVSWYFLSDMTAAGKKTSFTWASSLGAQRISSVTDAAGNKTGYSIINASLFPLRRVTTLLDPRLVATQLESDENGFTIAETRHDGFRIVGDGTQKTYSNGMLASLTDPRGGVFKFVHDAKGNLIQRTDALGHITKYTFDVQDNLLSITDPLNGVWRYTYNNRHQLASTTTPGGRKTRFVYNNKGQLITLTDAANHSRHFSYDQWGNLAMIKDGLGNSFTYHYSPHGLHLTSISDPAGNSSHFLYDANDRLTQIQHPDQTRLNYGYDPTALVSNTDENRHTQAFTRDALLNILKLTDAAGYPITYTYDANSNRLSAKNILGGLQTYQYNGENQLIMAKDANGYALKKNYDGLGNVLGVTDPRGNTTNYRYDGNHRLLSRTDPAGHAKTVQYDALGRKTAIINARGDKVSYGYSLDSQLLSKSYVGGVVANYAYDVNGRMASYTGSQGKTTYSRDGLGRITTITYPDNHSIGMAYDNRGALQALSYPGGARVAYTYDNRGRVKTLNWGQHSISYTYDGVGNLLTATRSNGVTSEYNYDVNDRMLAVVHKRAAAVVASRSYQLNVLGAITTVSKNPASNFTYSAEHISTSYDVADQITRRTTPQTTNTYSYDADGNLTGIQDMAKQVLFTAAYDPENRLIRLVRGSLNSQFTYNALGQRVGVSRLGVKHTHHYDHAGRLLFITDGNAQLQKLFIYSGRQLVAMQTGSGTVYFYHFDKMGNTLVLTDGQGVVVARYDYSPEGVIVQQTGTVKNPFTYVGEFGVLDAGQNLYFMKHRYYDAQTGRFLSRDPVGFSAGINLYAYAEDNPVNRIDPLGLDPTAWGSTFADFMRGFNFSRKVGGEPLMENPYLNTRAVSWETRQAAKSAEMRMCGYGMEAEVVGVGSEGGAALGLATGASAAFTALLAWYTAGDAVEGVGHITGSEAIVTTGIAMKGVLTDPDYWDSKRIRKEWGYFGMGLKEVAKKGFNRIRKVFH